MPGKPDLDALIDGLRSDDAIRRDSAVARLRVIGPRSIARLAALIRHDANPAARVAALNALDGMDDTRVLAIAVTALTGEPAVGAAAARVLRGWVAREPGTTALDALMAVATDEAADGSVRAAARDALAELPRDLIEPTLTNGALPAAVSGDEPASLREWLSSAAARAPLSALHDAVIRAGEAERQESNLARRREWLAVRGAAHLALARRGSRIVLYDLRDAFSSATAQLPLDFLAAVRELGDASCLEPLARAWAAAPADTWWRDQLAAAAALIVDRTRLSGRSALVKRIRAKWPGFL
jgi:hypothetical protein